MPWWVVSCSPPEPVQRSTVDTAPSLPCTSRTHRAWAPVCKREGEAWESTSVVPCRRDAVRTVVYPPMRVICVEHANSLTFGNGH